MKSRRANAVLTVLMVLMVMMAACAAPTPQPAEQKISAAPVIQATSDDTRVALIDEITFSKDKPTEITFTHRYAGVQLTGLQQIVNDFNTQNPYGISVKLDRVDGSYEDLYNHISTRLQDGNPPNIGQAYQNQASFYRNNNSLVDLVLVFLNILLL